MPTCLIGRSRSPLLCLWIAATAVAACTPLTDATDLMDERDAPVRRPPDLARPHDLAVSADLRSDPGDSPEVSIIVEPGDSGSALIAAINAANKSIHMTMYLLTDSTIRSALISRHQAAVEVKVILNQKFPGGDTTANTASFNALKAAGVPVVWAPASFPYTHEKTLVIDGKTAWILTMNASAAALTKNREYLAIDRTPADVAEAEAQFAADFARTPYTPTGSLLMSPVTARPGLLTLISSAHTTLDFEDEELSDSGITMALCNARARGVRVRGVLSDATASTAEQAAVAQLKACGVAMGSLHTPYLHAKAIVADGARVYVGSANFTAESLDHNRELGLLTATAAAVAPVAATVANDLAAATAL